ncbi:MAG: DegT/DnrJ/EryC1/StrS family aminotransferase [candidate division Zixibacteria bacterium]|nr:DegT/DnrJ/EryC1/StrS family aminotransferase [candidate division Zixibacteria bacterium]
MSDIRHRLARPDLGDEELAAVKRVFESGYLIQGPEVEALEGAVCELTGARYAVAVSSGTAALHVAYLATGVAPGDGLLIPSYAWPSAANLALMLGARPYLVDVSPDTYNLDVEKLRRRIQKITAEHDSPLKAVVPVHQFGLPCDIAGVVATARAHGLDVIEDAACALGARIGRTSVGCYGRLGIFSLHPRKSVTTGEGGIIVTGDDDLAERCRALRDHGRDRTGVIRIPGLNYRLTEMAAAVGNVQLKRLPAILRKKRRLVEVYLSVLAGDARIDLPAAPEEHTWQTFMVVVVGVERRHVIDRLRETYGIESGVGSVDAHSLDLFREQPEWEHLPVSERLADCGLALPLHARMSEDDAAFCAESLVVVLNSLS